MEIILSNESTKEDVVKFFIEKSKITEDVQNKLKRENITGEILPLLTRDDFKDLGLKFGPIKKWEIYFGKNKDRFTPKEIKEIITPSSAENEVKSFFERCLDFKGDLQNMNGQKLIELNEEEMKKIGLNLGKRKKLIEYIKYFKTLNSKGFTEEQIKLTNEKDKKSISQFLEWIRKFI